MFCPILLHIGPLPRFLRLSIVNAHPSTAISCVAIKKYNVKKKSVNPRTSIVVVVVAVAVVVLLPTHSLQLQPQQRHAVHFIMIIIHHYISMIVVNCINALHVVLGGMCLTLYVNMITYHLLLLALVRRRWGICKRWNM